MTNWGFYLTPKWPTLKRANFFKSQATSYRFMYQSLWKFVWIHARQNDQQTWYFFVSYSEFSPTTYESLITNNYYIQIRSTIITVLVRDILVLCCVAWVKDEWKILANPKKNDTLILESGDLVVTERRKWMSGWKRTPCLKMFGVS